MMPLDMMVKQLRQVHLLHKPQQHSHIPHHLCVGLDFLFHLPLLFRSYHRETHLHSLLSLLSILPNLFFFYPLSETKVLFALLSFASSPPLCYPMYSFFPLSLLFFPSPKNNGKSFPLSRMMSVFCAFNENNSQVIQG